MGVTLSTAADRRRQAARPPAAASRGLEGWLLLAGSVLFLLGLLVTLRGVSAEFPAAEKGLASGAIRDLSRVTGAAELLPLLAEIGKPGEREAAAEAVARRLQAGPLPNVGELSRLTDGAGKPLFRASEIRDLKPRLVVRPPARFRSQLWLWAAVFLAGFWGVHAGWRWRRFAGDPLFLPLLLALTSLGFLILTALRDPLRDLMLFRGFAQGTLGGCGFLLAASLLEIERSPLRRLRAAPLLGALALSVLLILFGSGPGSSDAKVNLFGTQPVEAIKLLAVLFLAGYFCDRWEFLRELKERRAGVPAALALPRLEYALPPLAAVGVMLAFFFLQRDLGPALVLSFLFLLLYAAARGRVAMALAGTLLIGLAFLVSYQAGYPRTVGLRIGMWLSPWDTTFHGGDHLAQSLWSLASGGLTGTGLGQGEAERVPAAHTDLVLAALGEELGLLGLLVTFALYALLLHRGLLAARRAAGAYGFFLALGLTVLLALETLLIAGGVVGLLPLSGIATPFLSSGRSAMLANFLAVGLLLAVSARPGAGESAPFARLRGSLRPVGWVLAAALGLVVLRVAWLQGFRADRVLTRGVLALQGDGDRRFQYNPRLAAIAATIPRGTIVDRNGLPLAASDPMVLAPRRTDYERIGGDLPVPALLQPGKRLYPLGPKAFHLLGDLNSRVNWAAPNTSFVERDFRIRLQGYDDYAAVVEVRQPDGRLTRQIQLDYSELIPLWRHRGNPDHPAVRRLLQRDRTLHLTVDARLQMAAAAILERYAGQAGYGAAAVVLDARTGDLLANVSYPWPLASLKEADAAPSGRLPRLIDRARYGIYPPGSTFKVVTAMAALRLDPALRRRTFECKLLPDGRVGNSVRGWGRPIRDDPTDKVPHGTVDLDRGIRASCNAYFAQLGTAAVGAKPLLETAQLFGIDVARPNTPKQLQDALPQAAYGQGQVTATPFQMARVAATVADGGSMPEGRWVQGEENPRNAPPRPILDAAATALIAQAMRGVVTEGTAARFLAEVVPPIAGKTGTAEVRGKGSHSWFIGFAPYGGTGGRKIAVAVIVEHGGYGGRLAAPAAGEIVRAAAELGLLK